MSLLNVECKKCGEQFKIDIKDQSIEQTKERLSRMEHFSFCPGNHIELSSPVNYLILKDIVPGNAPTEQEFIEKLKSEYKEVYENKELSVNYEVSGFSCGCCICRNKITGKKAYFDFKHSPAGKRFYYKIGDE